MVRGGPGWIVMSPEDLARFGLLVATGGVWKGERLIGEKWLRGHAGLDIHVVVNSRGRNGSAGEWDPYVNEPQDGGDAQQWIVRQAWSDGKVGTYGQSYNAFTQIMSAPAAGPNLKCILPLEGQQSNFGHLYNDGVPQLNVIFTFGLYATGPTRAGRSG